MSDTQEDHLTKHKGASTLKLFFDLVFVFAITQVVWTLAHDLTWGGAARAAILLGVLWWGWSGCTWGVNLVDFEPRWRRIVMLLAMASTFVMAYSVPNAFEGDGLWVAVPYLIMTQLGAFLMLGSLRGDPATIKGILKFSPISMLGGVLLVVGAIADGPDCTYRVSSPTIRCPSTSNDGRLIRPLPLGYQLLSTIQDSPRPHDHVC